VKRLSYWLLAVLACAAMNVEVCQGDDLTIGSKAPSIDIEHWVQNGGGKFSPVKEFESGKVYIIEFLGNLVWSLREGDALFSGSRQFLQNATQSRQVQLL